MLDDIMLEEFSAEGTSVYSAYSKLSSAAAPSGTIAVMRAASADKAKSAVEKAMGILVGGNCISLASSGYAPIAMALDAYKARAIARIYANGASAADMAERMARDLAAGGDGSAYFRLADRIAAVKADDVARVAKLYLSEVPMAWSAAGPADLMATLAE